MPREEFERTIVAMANASARRVGQVPLTQVEADRLYAQYIRGKGSLFAVPEDEA